MRAYQSLLCPLFIGIVMIGACSPEDSAPITIVKGNPAHTYSNEYQCQLGTPGYESYCEDFGSQGSGGSAWNCPSSFSSQQCVGYAGAMQHLAITCPEVAYSVNTMSYYAIHYYTLGEHWDNDGRHWWAADDDHYLYGFVFMDMNNIWLTSHAFDYGQLATTIAHEFGHLMYGLNEDAAGSYGNTCGAGSQYLHTSAKRS